MKITFLSVLFVAAALRAADPIVLTPDTIEYAGLPAAKAAEVATVPEGYELKVFAAEPDIVNPIAFCMDDRARLWVVEGMTYPTRAKEGEGKDRILVFEDTDGDGVADKRTVFIEGLNLVSGIEVGFGGVFVGAAPNLLFIPIADGDAPKPAGDTQVLLDGWGYQDTHETLNTFHWGPDGWLYGCHGVFTQSNVGKPGTPDKERTRLNAGVWRYQPQRKEFEVFAHGTSNPWGLDFNADGECFVEACVIPHLWHIIPGGRYQRQAGQHFDPHTYDDIKTIADHRHFLGDQGPHAGNGKSDAAGGGHAHAGLCIPQHPSWPDSIRGNALMGNIHGARINMDILEAKGSGYVGHHGADFINFHDKASQIIDLREGPEGTLFMIDWYDLNQCHNPKREAHDYTTGRIYRLAKKGAKVARVDLGKMDDNGLIKEALLGDEWNARHAQQAIQARTLTQTALTAGIKVITDWLDKENTLDNAQKMQISVMRRALTLRHIVTGFTDKKVVALSKKVMPLSAIGNDSDMPAAFTALVFKITTEDRDASPEVLAMFVNFAKDHISPVVRLALASACQRLTLEQRKPIVLALLAHAEDADDHNLPLMDWYAAEPLVAADPAFAVELLAACKIPRVQEFIARRMADK